ncbi:calcium-binding protein [Prochlorococcus sp. MIT 0707]
MTQIPPASQLLLDSLTINGGENNLNYTISRSGVLTNTGDLENATTSSSATFNVADGGKFLNKPGATFADQGKIRGTINVLRGGYISNAGEDTHNFDATFFTNGKLFCDESSQINNWGTFTGGIDADITLGITNNYGKLDFWDAKEMTIGGALTSKKWTTESKDATIDLAGICYNSSKILYSGSINGQQLFYNYGSIIGSGKISSIETFYNGQKDSTGTQYAAKVTIESKGEYNNQNGATPGDGGEFFNCNQSTLTIESNATFDNSSGVDDYSKGGVLTNNKGANIVNNGNILTIGGTFTNNGTLSGTGLIIGDVITPGTLSPGNSAGGHLINGNLYQKQGSTKEIELGGTYHGDGDRTATEHDWIEITGDLELAGDLDVSLIDGFKLSAGDSFVIAKVDGDLAGEYDGLNEGDSVGRFKSEKGGKLDLFLTYEGGDGNDIELYTKSFFSVLPDSLRDPRIIGSDDKDSLTGTSADEVIFGGSDDDVLLGGAGDDQVTGGNGNDKLNGGLGDDTLKGDRGADDYILSSGEDVYESFSIDENDQLVVGEGVDLSFQQVGDNLLIKGIAIHTTLLDVDKDEFLAADCIDYI